MKHLEEARCLRLPMHDELLLFSWSENRIRKRLPTVHKCRLRLPALMIIYWHEQVKAVLSILRGCAKVLPTGSLEAAVSHESIRTGLLMFVQKASRNAEATASSYTLLSALRATFMWGVASGRPSCIVTTCMCSVHTQAMTIKNFIPGSHALPMPASTAIQTWPGWLCKSTGIHL